MRAYTQSLTLLCELWKRVCVKMAGLKNSRTVGLCV